jgi:phosphoribosylaminoimidazolecarboxamide formyltransferase/IMP cyclohydrolase
VDPADYDGLAAELKESGALSDKTRHALAVKAFRHTSAYDNAVQSYLAGAGSDAPAPEEGPELSQALTVELVKVQDLRYGENPHQRAAFYREPLADGNAVTAAKQLQGKELSFNNILDIDAALGLAAEFGECACAIIKHGNPCGAALGSDPAAAYERALACDPMSAFGGVIAYNRTVDGRTAQAMAEHFFEAIIAPAFDAEARAALKRKKKLRLLELADLASFRRGGFDLRRVSGGMLAQDWDVIAEKVRDSEVVTKRRPTEEEWKALEFGWTIAKNVKSNAIVYTFADRTVGIGAGQMSRVDSARIGVEKAQSSLEGCAMSSDAFFPFRDGIDAAAEAGVKAVVQPGGSIRDAEVVEAADEHGMAMVFTGRRHFRH